MVPPRVHDPGQDPVIAARLSVPGLPAGHVDRPRLLAMLESGVKSPLTLISAPAGSGKTALAAAWVRVTDREVGWVTFEAGDERPAMFWPLVLQCLRSCGVPLPVALDNSSMVQTRVSTSKAVAALPESLTLVLDGFEIADAELADALDFVLRHCDGRLGVVMLTRADPVLPLHRYRLSGSMCEIRMRDLAFTTAEAEQLARACGLGLEGNALGSLMERTRGWAAGLRFAAMALERCGDPDAAVLRLTGDTGNVAEFLMKEILEAQTPDIRDLLLRTSVVDLLQPGLSEELAGRSASRTLGSLAHANMLVDELVEPAGWFSYHPFLRDLLRAELRHRDPDLLVRLQRRAADWYDAQSPSVDIAERGDPRAVQPLVEPLTRREREVLGHLADLLTTEEIAATMFVSVNTVRTHVRHILRKLAVSRRNQAVRKAHALRLIGTRPNVALPK